MVCVAFMLGGLHKKDSAEKKPANLLIKFLEKVLNQLSLPLTRQAGGET